jgi:hypothetical protein
MPPPEIRNGLLGAAMGIPSRKSNRAGTINVLAQK